jgi:uncharacterized protein YndB with AHSA1/START domain
MTSDPRSSETSSRFVTVTYIRSTPEALWDALVTPKMIRQYWNGAVHESSWTPGAPWILTLPDGRVADRGEVLEYHRFRRMAVTWRNEFKEELLSEGLSRCRWEIESDEGNVVKLIVTHEIDCPNSKFIAAAANSWPAILAGLKTLLETGVPLDMSHHWPSKKLRAGQA